MKGFATALTVMGGCNGCKFGITANALRMIGDADTMKRLDALLISLTDDNMLTVVDGEEREQLAWAAMGEDHALLHKVLNEIFDNGVI